MMLEPIRLLQGGPMIYRFPELVQASEDIGTACKTMMDELETLNRSLDTKLADWDGGSYGSYTDTKTAWNTAAANIQGILQTVARAVLDSSTRMQEQELRNAQRFMRG